MKTQLMDTAGQNARRKLWNEQVRSHISEWIDPSGSGKIPQFNAPYREPVWILPALYTGDREHIDLANRIVARYHDAEPDGVTPRGKRFDVFQTNCFSELYFAYRSLLTPDAEAVMRWHVEQALKTYAGSAQPDFVFRGGNDNMPAHSTCGVLLAGQALGDRAAISHGRWNLRQLRQLLARNAWMSEFNSTTYSAVTLTSIAAIAGHAEDEEIRDLALDIEHRIWAEVLLHYHPGTMHHAGPMSRAYAIDAAGHNHNLHAVMWYAFGPEETGRDLVASYFEPDGREVVHFGGCYAQSIAEYTFLISADLHVPSDVAALSTNRSYPATLRGTAEIQLSWEAGGVAQAETYMEPSYSFGTCSRPFCGGEQTASLYATYRRRPEMRDWRDAATAFPRYSIDETPMGTKDTSSDGGFAGDRFLANHAWCYTAQKENTAVLLTVPNLREAPIKSSSLKLSVVFPAHFGKIGASVIGSGPVQGGAAGESAQVEPVSVEAGEVFIHVQPLVPTSLPRQAAVRFSRQNEYEVLDLINYEGGEREFDRVELSRILNGMAVTVDDKHKYASLLDFHRQKSDIRVVDYLFVGTRFFEFHRDDVWFRLVTSTDTMGVITELVDGLPKPPAIMESNQIDVSKLPFVGERSEPNFPFFPWDKMEILGWPNSWIIGSRGVPGEKPYTDRTEALVPYPDGPKRG